MATILKKACRFFFSALIVSLLFSINSCTRPAEINPLVYGVQGKAVVNGTPLLSSSPLTAGDTVETMISSYFFMNIGERYFAVVYPGSRFSINYDAKRGTMISLERGRMYLSGGKGISLAVPDCIASPQKESRVIITAWERSAELKPASGEIPLEAGDTQKSFTIKSGYATGLSNGKVFSPSPLTDSDIRECAAFEKFDRTNLDDASPSRWTADIKKFLLSFDTSAFAELSALRRLASEKGPLFVVNLRSGKAVTGAMSVRGRMTLVETIKGHIEIPTAQVKSVIRYGAL